MDARRVVGYYGSLYLHCTEELQGLRREQTMWKGQWIGCLLKCKPQWKAELLKRAGEKALVCRNGRQVSEIFISAIAKVSTRKSWFWTDVVVSCENVRTLTLPCLSKVQARSLVDLLEKEIVLYLQFQLRSYFRLLAEAERKIAEFKSVRRYLRRREIKVFCKSVRDSLSDVIDSLTKILSHPYTERVEEAMSCRHICQIVESALNPEGDFYKDRNEKFVREEILRLGNLLLGLNEEQQRAAIILEDRNLLIAAAGSGKTLTLIGKARYAIEQGLYKRGEIVALAFNKDATLDLTRRFKREWPLVSANQLPKAHTFHGLGNLVLRKTARAEGRRPPSFESATKKTIVSEIIEGLERDNAFLEAWTLFVALCAKPIPTEDAFETEEDYSYYLQDQREKKKSGESAGFETLKGGRLAKSAEELAIANWLWLKGVPYEYEKSFNPVPNNWSRLEPDFYFPDIDTWHEHFGINAQGKAPTFFADRDGYIARLELKKMWFDKHVPGRWFSTTSADYRAGKLFEKIEAELARRGQRFKPRSLQETLTRIKSLRQIDEIDLICRILELVRGNGYTLHEIVNRVNGATDSYRARAFLKVFWPIHEAYRQYLERRNRIDYEDMITRAAKYLEEGRYSSPYRLILVDEFQDLSPGRARLVHALLNSRQDSVLFGVGDDWQSINGFAGSDLSLFLEFETHFGEAWEGNLSQTFRCPQGISDVGAWFIMENRTGQKAKAIRSSFNPKTDGMIELIDLKKDDETLEEVERQLHTIETENLVQTTPAASGKIEVFILGRYVFEKTKGIDRRRFETLRNKFSSTMRLEYLTVHSSKGLEADYVFCVGMNTARGLSFPSNRSDDPLIETFLARRDKFPHAEERRLFYVALTRAKKKAYLLFRRDSPSIFVLELMNPKYQGRVLFRGQPNLPRVCPACHRGFLIERRPLFFGCSRYHGKDGRGCKYTRSSNTRCHLNAPHRRRKKA